MSYSLDEIIQKVSPVAGWFYEDQMRFLYPYAKQSQNIFEIGTFAGRSTLFWTLCNPDAQIITTDLVVGDPMGNVPAGTSINTDIVRTGKILSIHEHSHHLVSRFNLPIDLLFIDGAHDYNSVCQDIGDWLPKVSRGGIVVMHDYMDVWPTVKKACDDTLRGKYELLTDQYGLFVVRV